MHELHGIGHQASQRYLYLFNKKNVDILILECWADVRNLRQKYDVDNIAASPSKLFSFNIKFTHYVYSNQHRSTDIK